MSAKDDAIAITPEMKEELARTIERVLRLEEEKDVIASDIRELYNGLKELGLDPKFARAAVKRIRDEEAGRLEEQEYQREMAEVYYEYYRENT